MVKQFIAAVFAVQGALLASAIVPTAKQMRVVPRFSP